MMMYQKPELTELGSALDTIRSTTKSQGMKDNPAGFPTTAAYEADE